MGFLFILLSFIKKIPPDIFLEIPIRGNNSGKSYMNYLPWIQSLHHTGRHWELNSLNQFMKIFKHSCLTTAPRLKHTESMSTTRYLNPEQRKKVISARSRHQVHRSTTVVFYCHLQEKKDAHKTVLRTENKSH